MANQRRTDGEPRDRPPPKRGTHFQQTNKNKNKRKRKTDQKTKQTKTIHTRQMAVLTTAVTGFFFSKTQPEQKSRSQNGGVDARRMVGGWWRSGFVSSVRVCVCGLAVG